MELPHIGKQCNESSCKRLDFLPITCDACNNIFCEEHYTYTTHSCPKAYLKNNQVPVCPLCNIPIPVVRGQQPDAVVGAHIDNDCQSDPAKNRRQIFVNKCSKKGCKTKEVIPVICNDCRKNYCLKHRHTSDHACQGKVIHQTNNPPRNDFSGIQGNMSEDEALARALALSMQSASSTMEMDMALARQYQAEATSGAASNSSHRCNVS
ncbi:PREDICTED: AN1-type zinc finger protein 2A-like [Nicrophorus vespilloides]|uniref:AN1-type zinc finger protein 2A-like n=1 Tax=Nicrophorus vespilloides TaxID=110193 RepID=A0ABM1NC95_NICVS|nr:PREDICTED: AN1-type zinc finger protein 2A-like [Nicrophorus vespilloides]